MFPFLIRMHLQTLLIVFFASLTYGQDRQIVSKLNPGCQTCDTTNTLIYVKADGTEDTIHQIWDFTKGMPTVIYAVASLKSRLDITWRDTEPVFFNLTETPIYSFAATIDKLFEYEDCKDIGHFDNKCTNRALSLRDVLWRREQSVLNNKEAMVNMHGLYSGHLTTGIVDVRLDLLPFQDYAVDLPHLIHTANSTLIDVSLVNFTTYLNASRYALHFMMASTDSSEDTMNYTLRKSLDDEHTPGVFEIIEIKTPKCRSSDAGGFIQFRPVAYTERERSVSSSTNAYISTFNRTSLPKDSTLRTFYRDLKHYEEKLLVQDMFISFGLPGDGYYNQHKFISWSFTYGYGSPPIESVSMFVIIIIAIGLGVPVLLAVSGITYVLVRRYKQRHHARFTDSE